MIQKDNSNDYKNKKGKYQDHDFKLSALLHQNDRDFIVV